MEAQEWMTIYYNIYHVFKQFRIGDFVKLLIKNLKLKYCKLSSCWVGLFKVLEWIDEQAYKLALFNKYARLHSIFLVQLLEDYHYCHDNAKLMAMSDLKDLQNEWDVEEVWDK